MMFISSEFERSLKNAKTCLENARAQVRQQGNVATVPEELNSTLEEILKLENKVEDLQAKHRKTKKAG